MGLSLAPTAPVLGAATLLQCREQLGTAAFVHGTGRCAPERTCVGVVVHVVMLDGVPVQSPQWFHGQLSQANRLFEPIGVGFEAVAVRELPAALADVDDRSERDHLGRDDHDAGVVHVFVVRRLADVDIAGDEIRGVHWRDRGVPGRRIVILSSIAGDMTLAHELGHFFGLPHSRYAISVMNKTPRDDPPWSQRSFHPRELAIMRRDRDRMLSDGTLVRRPGTSAR